MNLFYIAPNERGTGVADALHGYMLGVLRRENVASASLSVSPSNARALRFYTRHGWAALGPRADRPQVHTMRLALSGPNE